MSGNHPGDDRLVALALDDLDAPERDEVERHVVACDGCRRTLDTLRRVLHAYRTAPDPPPPAAGLVRLLEAQAARRRGARPSFGARPVLALAAAAMLLAFAGGYWAGQRQPRPPERPVAARLASPLPPPPAVTFHAAVAGS